MAQFNRYVYVPHDSYQQWRDATLGNGYNVDGSWGNQCWDFCALLYWQYNLTLQTSDKTVASCWIYRREANSQPPFTSLEGIQNIRRGDILVWDKNKYSSTGHIAFADEDYYNGMTQIYCLGQNQGQGTSAGSNITRLNLTNFLGIFRNTDWSSTPPPPPPSENKKSKFPFPVAWEFWGW